MKLTYLAAAAAVLAISAPAHAALIVSPILTGPFNAANPIGTVQAFIAQPSNTYNLTFTLTEPGVVLAQLQSSIPGLSEPIEFDLFAGAPGAGTLVAQSTDTVGPSVTNILNPGVYYLEPVQVVNSSLVTGGIHFLSAIPEPAAWSLMLGGVLGVGAALRRRLATA